MNYKNKETGNMENIKEIYTQWRELVGNTPEFKNYTLGDFVSEFYEEVDPIEN